MQVANMRERIREFLIERFPPARIINNDAQLLGSGLVDSLGVLEIVTFLECEFHIPVTDEDLLPENFQSITSLVSFVQSKLNGVPVCQGE